MERKAVRISLGVVVIALMATLAIAPGRVRGAAGWPSADTFVAASSDAMSWILPAHTYSGNRYVDMPAVTPANVASLKKAWTYKLDDDSPIEASPVIWHGVMYVTSAHDHVYALDAKTGAPKWKFSYKPHVIAFAANRGVALAGGHVFVGTLDGHLISLDAATGKKNWDIVGVHDTKNSFYSMQPVPYKNMLLMGVSNGDWGGIGYVTAFDQATGKRVWEWKTIPGPGEAGHETWSGDSWKRGGAAVWSGLAIDEKSDTLFMDLGNPQPDFFGESRKGDNLYSNSMVALDIAGPAPKLKWYYQFIKHDTHDWDPAMPPVRFTGTVAGKSRELVAAGDKGGNFWVLDANDGKLVYRAAVSTQKGQDMAPSRDGNIACPNTNGGVEYNGGSYDPKTNMFYVPSVDECGVWKKLPRATYLAGQFYLGGLFPKFSGPSTGWMNAIDISTGKFAWRTKEPLPALGGALATSSGLVFTGMLTGQFKAFDAKTGKTLWHDATGSPIIAPPASYEIDGKQFVAIASGQAGNQLVPAMPKVSPGGSFVTAYAR
ncbi:MAG: PQQ-dependent methanol/ethanol family dehydrogenase [Vulcanimicrobiaceae bacterium]